MLVTFAFLAHPHLHHVIRRLALEIHRTHHIGLHAGLLPPHISLKQPFQIADLPELETFFDRFAASIAPFDLTLTHVSGAASPNEMSGRGVIWLEVQESLQLRGLHERLNTELAHDFRGTEAAYDGATYHFHATVALVQEPPRYHQVLEDYGEMRVDITYQPEHLAMFYYDDDTFAPGTYLTYKVLPLDRGPGSRR
ncbi:MAG: 2'-5' RNA ligase family protein [Herpetosiphonaceae bacterium]|nr:2'-5' RNA ligase family protein [Herpetosiphonaceae bacterium]